MKQSPPELPLNPCADCGKPVPFFSMKYQVPLCRNHWDYRTGWDLVKDYANAVADDLGLERPDWRGDKLFEE